MGIDIRTPIGLMFSVLGVILFVFGLVGSGEIYNKSLGMNVNLWWGIVLVIFGVGMLSFGMRSRKATAEEGHVQH